MPIDVVRSEEQVRMGVRRRAHERVVVRTKVVTAQVDVTITVPVRRQVLEIQQIPLHDDGSGPIEPQELGPDVVEVVLHEERPVVEVVDVSVVPVERVRVTRGTQRVSLPVSVDVGREVVDVVRDIATGPHGA